MEPLLVSAVASAAAASSASAAVPLAAAVPAALRLLPRAGAAGGSRTAGASATPLLARAYYTRPAAAAAGPAALHYRRPRPRWAPAAAAALVGRRPAASSSSSSSPTATYASSAAAEAALKQPNPSSATSSGPMPTFPGKIDVAEWLDAHAKPYKGDASFLAGPTPRTLALWKKAEELLQRERDAGGVLAVDAVTPATITSHAPGYVDRDLEIVVGLQTDEPLKRAIKPKGGVATVKQALEARGFALDPLVERIFTDFRKTQNAAIFDAYTKDVRAARSSGLLTGLPDAYGRGRIIGDYRRAALYGVDALIAAKEKDLLSPELSASPMTEEKVRLREEVREQVRALQAIKEMSAAYGCDVSKPATTAKEAVQFLYLAYLAAIKEQDGAAMSLGRIDAFLDLYIERDLQTGVLESEAEAQELIDDLVIKLRLTRQLRTPDYDALFAGDPTWATLAIGGSDSRGDSRVTKTSFRLLQTLRNLGPAPEPNMTVLWNAPPTPGDKQPAGKAAEQQAGWREFAARVSIETSSIQFENDALMRSGAGFGDDYAIACCVSAMRTGKDLQLFGARTNLAKALLYAINGGRDELTGKQVGPASWPKLAGDDTTPLDYDQVASVFYSHTLPWLADLYAKAMNIIHAQHDRYNYEAAQLSLMDTHLRRLIAFGVSGFSVVADSLSALKHARVYPQRDPATGLVTGFRVEGDFPKYGNDDDRVDGLAVEVLEKFYGELKKQHTYRGAIPTLSVLTITSNVAYGKRTGATPDGRAKGVPFAPGANPLHGRDASGALASLASVAKLPYLSCLDGISNTFSLVAGSLGRGDEASRAQNLARVLDGYFSSGGHHVNINCLSRDQLLDAMEHPERYPNLTIRVSGYAVRFINLSREQQLEVINRTMFDELK